MTADHPSAPVGLSNLPIAATRAAELTRHEVLATVEGRHNRYRVVDPRIREILAHAESIVRENATRLSSCLVLATEP